jgi:hypothetical protein
MKTEILLRNGLVEVPAGNSKLINEYLGTVLANLAYYGYVPSKELLATISKSRNVSLANWWKNLEQALKTVTGASKNMDKYVVYKNFPAEVLEKSKAEYWISQICMYLGCPNEYFTQPEKPRDLMFEKIKLKVLHLANENSLKNIYESLVKLPSRWTSQQESDFVYILVNTKALSFDASAFTFKENMAKAVALAIDKGINVYLKSATDVLRLGVVLSDGDVTFEKNTKFKSFSRKVRKYLLNLLENSTNLEEDVARDKERWKRFFYALHPNDFNFKHVKTIYNKLYKNKVESFNSKVEVALAEEDKEALDLLASRPGDFTRRLNHTLDLYGSKALIKYLGVLPKLKVVQLVKIKKYIQTLENRQFRTIAPKGNWTKLKVLPSTNRISPSARLALTKGIDAELGARLNKLFKNGVQLDLSTKNIKLQTNASDLSPYGRGTSFDIPENVNFVRSASYWQCKRGYNTWFDNGWNFFGPNWEQKGAVCWNNPQYTGTNDRNYWYERKDTSGAGAVFSGDPTNSKTADGRACQMIDLYIDKLLAMGVRYAVWNILCYSKIKFKDSEEVFASLQWGEDAQSGKLFEPSRAQLTFPVQGDTFTKYICYIDLQERKAYYIDANLKASTSSALQNCKTLEEKFPAFVEYLSTLPSVYDVFAPAKKSEKGLVVSYTDEKYKLNGQKAYVFKALNKNNKFEPLNISEVLSS